MKDRNHIFDARDDANDALLVRQLLSRPDAKPRDFDPAWLNSEPSCVVDDNCIFLPARPLVRYYPRFAAAALIFVLFGALFALWRHVYFPEPTFRVAVLESTGECFVIRGKGTKDKLKPGDVLEVGSRVETHSQSSVSLLMGHLGAVRLGENTHLQLTELVLREKSKSAELILEKGRLLNQIRLLSREDSFRVVTPVAIAGVRGTAFTVETDGQHTSIGLLRGKLEVQPKSGGQRVLESEQAVLVEEGVAGEVTTLEAAGELREQMLALEYQFNTLEPEAVEEASSASSGKVALAKKRPELIRFRNGNTVVGYVLSQTGGRLEIQTDGGVITVGVTEIRDIGFADD